MSLAPATLQCAHHLCMALSNGVEGTTYEGWSDPSFDFVTLRGKRAQLARVAVFLASHGVKLSTSVRSHADVTSRAQVAAIAVADIARKLGRDGYTGERIATRLPCGHVATAVDGECTVCADLSARLDAAELAALAAWEAFDRTQDALDAAIMAGAHDVQKLRDARAAALANAEGLTRAMRAVQAECAK